MWLGFKKTSFEDLGSARCGRCATILPDETLSYCPHCGIPFSIVPATTEFVPLAEYQYNRSRRQARILAVSLGSFVALIFLTFLLIAQQVQRNQAIADLKKTRKLSIYFSDFREFPQLSDFEKKMAISYALQGFQDHFEQEISHYEVFNNRFPGALGEDGSQYQEEWSNLYYWENKVIPELSKNWSDSPYDPLVVYITNIPIRKADKPTAVEVMHLGKEKLISGLAHPSFVVISSFRLLNEMDFSEAESLRSERAKHLGEYIIAHELGHALLGLPEFVVQNRPQGTALRAPANFNSYPEWSPSFENCLMHTDIGGGREAWSHIKNRKIGAPSNCQEYKNTIQAFKLRSEAIDLLKIGHRARASHLFEEAVALLDPRHQSWVIDQWRGEQKLFDNPFQFYSVEFKKP